MSGLLGGVSTRTQMKISLHKLKRQFPTLWIDGNSWPLLSLEAEGVYRYSYHQDSSTEPFQFGGQMRIEEEKSQLTPGTACP